MGILRNSIIVGTLLSSAGLSNYSLSFLSLPNENNNTADLTAVFTGGNGRVKDALKTFAQNCNATKKWLFISGAGKRTTLSALLRHNKISLPQSCEKRIMIGSHARNTAGNARELNVAIEIIENEFNFPIRSIKLRTAWCHTPRSMAEIHNHLESSAAISTQYAGSCDLTAQKGMKLFFSEVAKLPFAQFEKSEMFSKPSFSYEGKLRIGRKSLSSYLALKK